MNIKFLGHGNILSSNNNSSFLINEFILVGMPPGTLKELNKNSVDLDKIKIIILTSLEGEQIFDLPFLIFNEVNRERKEPLIIIGPKETRKRLSKLIKLAFNISSIKMFNKLKITFIDALIVQNKEISENTYLSFIKLNNSNFPDSYGFILECSGKQLGFIGNTSLTPGVTYILKKIKYCLISISNREEDLSLEDLISLAKEYLIKYLPFNYPDNIEKKLHSISNVRIIKTQEQFHI